MNNDEAKWHINRIYGMVSPDIQRSLDVALRAMGEKEHVKDPTEGKVTLIINDPRQAGFELAQYIQMNGSSELKLSRFSGYSRASINRWLTGESTMKTEVLADLARAAGADEVVIRVRRAKE